jgi:hypothetical protein
MKPGGFSCNSCGRLGEPKCSTTSAGSQHFEGAAVGASAELANRIRAKTGTYTESSVVSRPNSIDFQRHPVPSETGKKSGKNR